MAAEGGGVAYITFDMQKTLPRPMLSTCAAFYLRQIWLYNVGIHLVQQGASRQYFHIWSEDQASRGCHEVGSALLTFFKTVDVKEKVLVAWYDSCAGQNENFFILCLWQYLIAKKQFQVIHHKFPEPGHSYQQTALSTRLRVTLRLHLLQVLIHQILLCVHAYLNIVNTSVTMQRLPNNTLRHSFLPFSVVTGVDVAVTKFQNLSSVKLYNDWPAKQHYIISCSLQRFFELAFGGVLVLVCVFAYDNLVESSFLVCKYIFWKCIHLKFTYWGHHLKVMATRAWAKTVHTCGYSTIKRQSCRLVDWSLTSLFSTNTAIPETKAILSLLLLCSYEVLHLLVWWSYHWKTSTLHEQNDCLLPGEHVTSIAYLAIGQCSQSQNPLSGTCVWQTRQSHNDSICHASTASHVTQETHQEMR